MSFHYDPRMANNVDDALSRLSTKSTTHVDDDNKVLVKDVHRLARLGVRLIDSTSGGFSVHPISESSLVAEVKKGWHLYPMFMEFKDSVQVHMNESFAVGGDSILRYQG